MENEEFLNIISKGEDSYHQFKANVTNVASLAAELASFSNTKGGRILIGVGDDGKVSGLNGDDISRINQLISNAASQSVRPAINPVSENINLPDGVVIVVNVHEGLNKPYTDNSGFIWVKNGSDKRKVTAREELQRMFQSSSLIHADETPVAGSSVAEIDLDFFRTFFEKKYGESLEEHGRSLSQTLENMNLLKDNKLNICGSLLFSKNPQLRLPMLIVKAVAFRGIDIEDQEYADSRDISGKISDMFNATLSFILSNIHHIQGEQSINSLGAPEIPRIVFEELLVNAFIHRDYFISASIRVLIFKDRIEIISPGHLPNNLTVENIRLGNSNARNPILTSFTTNILPYRGIGSGILRATKAYSNIDFIDDRTGNLFKVIIRRI